MSGQLPPNPSLEQLKKQAKGLSKLQQTADSEALTRIRENSRCFLRPDSEFPRFRRSAKGVRERDASDLLPILKVFTVKDSTLPLDCRSDDQ
jgi:hypothetical protein